MLDSLIGVAEAGAGSAGGVAFGTNPSQVTHPIALDSQSRVSNESNTGVGSTSGPTVNNGSTTGMTSSAETSGLSVQQAISQAVQALNGQKLSGDAYRNSIISSLTATQGQSGLTDAQIQSVATNSGIVGSAPFTQNPTASQLQGFYNQVLSAVQISGGTNTVIGGGDTPINNVANIITDPPGTPEAGDTTGQGTSAGGRRYIQPVAQVAPGTGSDGSAPVSTVGDPPVTGGASDSGGLTTPYDALASILSGAGGGGGDSSVPAAPAASTVTTTSDGTTSGGSSSLLLFGVLAAGGAGLWFFMHKKHGDAKAQAAA